MLCHYIIKSLEYFQQNLTSYSLKKAINEGDLEEVKQAIQSLLRESDIDLPYQYDEYRDIWNSNRKSSIVGTALHHAVKHKRSDIIKVLLENKANIEASDSLGATPLLKAVEGVFDWGPYSRSEIIVQLIMAKANINARDKDGRTILHKIIIWLSPREIPSILKILIRNKIKINQADNEGKTAIMYVFDHIMPPEGFFSEEEHMEGNLDFLKVFKEILILLIHNGADINKKDIYGKNALARAKECQKAYENIKIHQTSQHIGSEWDAYSPIYPTYIMKIMEKAQNKIMLHTFAFGIFDNKGNSPVKILLQGDTRHLFRLISKFVNDKLEIKKNNLTSQKMLKVPQHQLR